MTKDSPDTAKVLTSGRYCGTVWTSTFLEVLRGIFIAQVVFFHERQARISTLEVLRGICASSPLLETRPTH